MVGSRARLRISAMLAFALCVGVSEALAWRGTDLAIALAWGGLALPMVIEQLRPWAELAGKSGAEPVRRGPVFGDVPQEPQAYKVRPPLMLALMAEGARAHVLIGLAGSGKTHLAAGYARRRIDDGWMVGWIDARDSTLMALDLASGAAKLGFEPTSEKHDDPGSWLRSRLESDGARCLLVFDGVTDPGTIRHLLPAGGLAQIVITSCSQATGILGMRIDVDGFTLEESVDYLLELTEGTDTEGASEIASKLSYLPLGLLQAAMVIRNERLSYPLYLERLRTLPVQDHLVAVEGDAHPHGLAEAIVLSLQALPGGEPGLCAGLIAVLSVLSPVGVSRSALRHAARLGAIGDLGDGEAAAAQLDRALGRGADRSLLTFDSSESVRGHPLVMRVVRERQQALGTLGEVIAAAISVLAGVAVAITRPWKEREAVCELAGHLTALNDHARQHGDDLHWTAVADLLLLRARLAGLMLNIGDRPGDVIQLCTELISDCEAAVGGDDQATLLASHHLGIAYLTERNPEAATPLLERVATVRARVLGPDHPDTLTSRHALGLAFRSARHQEEAIVLLTRVLADQERVLGPDDPDALASRNALGDAYRAAGDPLEALALIKQALAGRVRMLGPDHPDTLRSRSALGRAYHAARRWDEAIAQHERALRDAERILDSDHPDTVASRRNLAQSYYRAGRIDEAIVLYEQVVNGYVRIFGADHPVTRDARARLAAVRQGPPHQPEHKAGARSPHRQAPGRPSGQ